MNDLDLVVFDLAGTTIQDGGQVSDAFTAALAVHGFEITSEDLARARGSSKREAVLHFIPEGPERARHSELVYASFQERLTQRYKDEGVEPIVGAQETFRWLRDRGVRTALNTGFDRSITSLILSAVGWADGIVDAVICGDDVPQGRPAPFLIFRAMEATGTTSVHRVANIGDTVLDLQAGLNAGVRWNIGVLTGAHTQQILEQSPHTHLISTIAVLPDLWPADGAAK